MDSAVVLLPHLLESRGNGNYNSGKHDMKGVCPFLLGQESVESKGAVFPDLAGRV